MTIASRSLTIIIATLIACMGIATADAAEPPGRFEFTPFASYVMGGDFDEQDGDLEFDLESAGAFGFTLNGPAGASWPDGQWEFLYTHQGTEVDTRGTFGGGSLVDIDIDYVQFGGVYLFEGESVKPFIGMTLGLSRFDPRPGEFSAEEFFAASLGGGVKLNADGRVGVRLEGRVYTSFIDSNSSIFCESDFGAANCLIIVDSSTLVQWEARVGVVFRF